jgi:predicted phage terminase large subunit-like protein
VADRLAQQEAIRGELTRRAIERTRTERRLKGEQSLLSFIGEAWHVLEPARPLKIGWALGAICDHLQAVSYGDIPRLLINCPPGMAKSVTTCVYWNAFEWGPMALAQTRFFTASWSDIFAERDSTRTRQLIESEWYRERWGDRVRLIRRDATNFENTLHGTRVAVPFASMTSGRGDRVVIDDPHSTEKAESDTEREKASRIFRESVQNRVNDPKTSGIVVIMQRLHPADVSATAIELGYVHLMLPMEFEPERRCVTVLGYKQNGEPRTFSDPRTEPGELLFPERWDRHAVERDKLALRAHGTAGQLQQRPSAREGRVYKRDWFKDKIIDVLPAGVRWVRQWDLAGTEKGRGPGKAADPDYTAGVKLGIAPDRRIIVGHVVRGQWGALDVEQTILTQASLDGRDCMIGIAQDAGQAGKAQAIDYVRKLVGYQIQTRRETGDKQTRSRPFEAQCEAGNVFLARGAWNNAYLDELCEFPGGPHDDQVDASALALERLTTIQTTAMVMPIVVSGGPRMIPGS